MQLTPTSQRYTSIDVLRGLAALFVVYQHTSELTLNPALQINGLERSIIEFFTQVLSIGEIGVCIFFIISGFVVPFSLLNTRSNPIQTFIVHRFFRLYPAYWLSVPLGLVFVSWRFGVQYGGQEIHWPTFLINLTMVQAFVGVSSLMGQYWTLAVELLFYGLCLALFFCRGFDSFKAQMGVLVTVVLARQLSGQFTADGHYSGVLSMFRYLDFMFFGMQYRKWLLEDNKRAGMQAAAIFLFALVSFDGQKNIHDFLGGDHRALSPQLSQLAAIAIFVAFTRLRPASSPVGAYLGKVSYSIYLFHPVVLYPLFLFWFQSSPIHSFPHIFIAVSMALTVLVSSLTYQFIERPCMSIGRKKI